MPQENNAAFPNTDFRVKRFFSKPKIRVVPIQTMQFEQNRLMPTKGS